MNKSIIITVSCILLSEITRIPLYSSSIRIIRKRLSTVLFAGDSLGSNAYKPLVSFSIRSNSGAETSPAKELWWNYFRPETHK